MPAKRMQSSSSSTSTNNLAAPAPIPSFGLPHQQQQQQHHLQPSLSPSPKVKQSPSLPSFTRSASPSGLSNFFSRPTKWFTRTSSGSRASPVEHPRVSTSSTSSSKRRPTISGPTDPRPIDSIGSPGVDTKLTGTPGLVGLNDRASRSVLDLSSRASTDLNGAMMSSGSSGTGDLRSIARKGWSRSVDNLQIIPPSKLTPLNTSSSGKQQQQQQLMMSDMEMKIEQYRTRTPTTPASLASVSVSSTVNQKIYPFPTMPGTPGTPSTPPSEVPSLHQQQQQQQQHFNQHNQHQLRHAHSNSGSSSSLIPPSPSARLVPPMASPQKASRKRSFDFDRSKGKSLDAATSFSSSPSGGGGRSGGGSVGFPFYFGSSSGSSSGHHHNHHPERKNSTPVTPTPPTIIEPNASNAEEEEEEEEEGDSSKRASQIVHRAGFIMRLQNFSPCSPPQLSSNKNWKPFKMVLKGSKLYFHKPPGDRAAAIKELFPSGLVAVVEEEAAKEEGSGSRSGREREEARKRRAFWGRRTHPDLVVESGKVQRGTLEALVHESVFGTTFFSSPSQSATIIRTSDEENEDEDENDEDSWKDFASSVLFFLPYLVDRANFEHEFVRCASYFVSGAADEQEKESARKRVEWLIRNYIAYHSTPVDEESWRAFCRDVVPLSNASVSITGPPAGPPSLESSPNLNAFSPRPGDSEKMPSLSSSVSGLRFGVSSTGQTSAPPSSSPVLASPAHSLQSVKSSLNNNIGNGVNNGSASNARMRLWSLLDSAGFTREVLFRLEPDTVARSLLLYQRSILETVAASPHTKSTTSANGNMNAPPVGAEVLLAESPLSPLVEFFGCDDAPHWLTRVVIMQILGPGQSQNSSSSSSVGGAGSGSNSNLDLANDDPYAQQQQQNINSHTHVRAEVIARWARVGEMSRLAGDECSWRAIRAALCAKPIARLEKAWRRVDLTAMSVVRGWVYAFSSKDKDSASLKTGIVEPRISPWGGDGRYRALKLLEKLHEGKSNEWTCEGMYEARRIFDSFSASLESCLSRGRGNVHQREASEDEDALRLLQHWKEVSKRPPPMKIHRIDQFMSLSFAAEPKKKGLYAPYYWSRRTYTGPQVLIPLLVPESLPTITLIDRSQLVRTKKLSYESGAVLGDSQTTRPMELMYSVGPDGNIRAGGPRHRGSNAFDLGGMILPVFDGELLLCVVTTPPPETSSRPVSSGGGATGEAVVAADSTSLSRQPSIRVKSAAAGLDRKSSRARRASLPALSRRERTKTPAVVVIEPSTAEPPLHAIVQAGTLDALVHFLIHGLEGVTVSVADDNGEMALRDKKTRAVRVDRAEFARVWWPSFRSFVTPYVFFQLLRKDFLSSSLPRGSDSAEEAATQTVQSRQAVIRLIADWIHVGGGAQDALDDIELHSAIQSFFVQHDAEKDLSKVVSRSEELSRLYKEYEAERVALFDAFAAQTMRPQFRSIPVRGQTTTTTATISADDGDTTNSATTVTTTATAVVHNFGIRTPKLEEITPSELVDNLDAMASAAFRNVNQEDLYVTVDLLEVQTSDRTGWFLPREPSSGSEEVEIQSLYTFLMEVEPSSLIGEYSGDTLYRLLPPGVRSLLRAYCILRKWAICCLAAQQLGVKMRQARMEMFLRAIEVCRIRSVESQEKGALTDVNPAQRPCVRSFVEAVLTSAVVSPEGRIFSRAWQGVANARGTQVESLLSLLSARMAEPPVRKERLTVDPAWLLERMLEVITLSDVLDSPIDIETPLSLVNFDKRRQLHNIIANTSNYVSRVSRQRREMDRMDFERLNRIDQEVSDVVFDLRVLRDEAQREAASLGTPQTASRKSGPRPFQRAIAMQQEKIKRDRYMRERLMKEKRHEQQRLERKEDDLNRAMDMRGGNSQSGAGQKHQRGKRSMSALFSLMRPISTAFTSESGIAPKRSAAELDFTPSHKPALLLSMVDAHVTPFINNERSFTFQIDTEDGGHYLLQALSRNDMNQWMQTISTSIKAHAQRRLTYLGNASPIQVSDHLQQSRPLTASHDPKAVFGVDLTFLVRREAGGEEVPSDAVPSVLELCLREIEERGLTEQGIYRVAGATSEVTALRESLNNGQRHIDRYTDINAVCGVVKYWFRTLPETVIPETYFEAIIEAARTTDLDERLARIREIVHTFPRAHFSVLKRLAEHMDRVVDYEEQNHMTPDNLAVVICPNLLRAPSNNFGLIMKNMGPMTVLFKALITHMHFIFDETVEEGEEGEDVDEEEEFVGEEDEGKVPADSHSLFVPEVDFGPRFVASPEPDDLLQDTSSSPDR
ncbi:BEM2 [Sanghuangporus weigelae]